MYNVRHPKIHLSRVLDYDIKNKTYIITDDMVFDSEEELIDFLARYHYPKYNLAGNEIPGAYKEQVYGLPGINRVFKEFAFL